MRKLTTSERSKSYIVSIAGDPKTGKTFFSFSLPGPHFYHEFDLGGLNRVLSHLPEAIVGGVFVESYPILEALTQEGSEKLLQKFRHEYRLSVQEASQAGGTVILDTETLYWELTQNALVPRDDKAKKRGALKYGDANADYRGALNYARNPDHPCNLVLIHHTKEVWAEVERDGRTQWVATGQREPACHKESLSIVDMRLLMSKPFPGVGKTAFRVKVDQCGLDPTLEGLVIDPSGKTPGSIQKPPSWETIKELLDG